MWQEIQHYKDFKKSRQKDPFRDPTIAFECKQCGKRFQFPSLLKYHGPTHTGTKSNGSIIHRKEFVNSISGTEKHHETEGKFFLKI